MFSKDISVFKYGYKYKWGFTFFQYFLPKYFMCVFKFYLFEVVVSGFIYPFKILFKSILEDEKVLKFLKFYLFQLGVTRNGTNWINTGTRSTWMEIKMDV